MIILILFAALALRLINLNQSLWLDEAITALALKGSISDLIFKYAPNDLHPPLFYGLMWFWVRVLGNSEISLRLPSVLFALLTIFIFYKIAKKLLPKKYALLAALFLAVNPLHIYYSQEARMYSFAAFTFLLQFFFFLKFLNSEKRSFWGLFMANILLLGGHYLTSPLLFVEFIYLLLKRRNLLKKWLLACFLSLLVWGWWIPIFINQYQKGTAAIAALPVWKQVIGGGSLKDLSLVFIKFLIGRITFENKIFYILSYLPIFLLTSFAVIRSIKFYKTRILIYLGLLLPLVFLWLLSSSLPVFSYFRVLFLLPLLILIIASGVETLSIKKQTIFAATFISLELIYSGIYLFNPSFHREDWKGAVNFIRTEKSNSVVLFENSQPFEPFKYYGNDLHGLGVLKKIPANSSEDVDISKFESYPKILLFQYLVEITDSNKLVEKLLKERGYLNTQIYNFRGVGFIYLYEKPT